MAGSGVLLGLFSSSVADFLGVSGFFVGTEALALSVGESAFFAAAAAAAEERGVRGTGEAVRGGAARVIGCSSRAWSIWKL